MNIRLMLTAAIATVAASIALHPLIASSTWFWEGVGAVIVVAGVASLTRLRTLPVVVCLLATAIGLLLYVNMVFAGQHSLGGVLPTQASLAALAHLNTVGWTEAARFAPPVPGLRGVTFLAVAGIGLAALFTDLLAVRLRKAAAAGLPLLALFSATVASKASAPTIDEAAIFCAGVAGYLALLVADGRERIQLWGRLVSARQGAWPRPAAGLRTAQRPGAGQDLGPDQGRDRGPGQGQQVPVADTRALAAAGRRVGMAAVAAALVVPLLIPGLHVRDLFGGGSGGNGLGAGSLVTLPDPVDQMDQQLNRPSQQTIMTYHSDNTDPPYLRIYALDLPPTAVSWGLFLQQVTSLGSDGQMPGAPGLQTAQSRLTRTRVTVAHGVTGTVFSGSHTENFLPMPYPTIKVTGEGGGWAVDPETLMVWSGNSIGGLKYTVTSKDVEPTAPELRASPAPPASISAAELPVPSTFDSLGALARKITSGAVTNYDKAVELQQWFTAPGNFTYSLDASEPNSPAGLKEFLLNTKRGFCQQFAFAFAVLARLLGIPARVAVGYTAGTSLGKGNWRVTTSDAHAWPELYFQGAGWLPWEPTPAGTGVGQGTANPPSYTVPVGGPSGNGGTTGQPNAASTGPQAGQARGNGVSQQKRFVPNEGSGGLSLTRHNHRQWLWWLLVPGALLLIVLLLPLCTRLLTRMWRTLIITRGPAPGRSRGRGRTGAGRSGPRPSGAGTGPSGAGTGPSGAGTGPSGAGTGRGPTGPWAADAARARVHAAWLEVHDDLQDFGVGCPANESPRALVHRVTTELQLPRAPLDALGRLALAEERASYAASPSDLPALRADVTAVRRAFAASVSLRTRWRARIFPASKLSALRQSSQHALDVFGWIEVATSWLADHLWRSRRTQGDTTGAP
jgi:transglutaminase-like putative cysteine protease